MKEHLLPFLTEDEYDTLTDCLTLVSDMNGDDQVKIIELLNKLTEKTLLRTTYARSEGC